MQIFTNNLKVLVLTATLLLLFLTCAQAQANSGLITLVSNPNPSYPGPNSVISAVLDPSTGVVTGTVLCPFGGPSGTAERECKLSPDQVSYLQFCIRLTDIRRMKPWDLADALRSLGTISTIAQLNAALRECNTFTQKLIYNILLCLAD